MNRSNVAPALPHNLDAESSILGGVILRNDTLTRLAQLEVDDFYDWRHKIVWQAVRNLEAAGKPIDAVTLEVEIEKQGKLDAIGGIAFLGEFAIRVPTADNVATYANDTQLLAANRQASIIIDEVNEAAKRWPHAADEMLDELIARLQRARDERRSLDDHDFGDIDVLLVASIANLDTPPIRSYSTGNEELDHLLGGGINTRELAVVAGPPGGCKTAFAISTAIILPLPVLYLSTELEQHELMARVVANRRGCSWAGIRRGSVERAERVDDASGLPIYMLGSDKLPRNSGAVLELLERRAAKIGRKHGVPPVIVVDYLQQLARGVTAVEAKTRVADIANELRMLSQRLDCGILAVSSTSRSFYSSEKSASIRKANDASAYIAAAKESGDVEYDAARVLFLDAEDNRDKPERSVRIAVAKSRDGRTGFAGARVISETGRFFAAPEVLAEMDRAFAQDVTASRGARTSRGADAGRANAHAIANVLGRANEPMSRNERAPRGAEIGHAAIGPAVDAALAEPTFNVVEVYPSRNGAYRLWTRERALAANRGVVESTR